MSKYNEYTLGQWKTEKKHEHLKLMAQMSIERKKHVYGLMGIGPGSVVLDVGCGIGADTIPLAGLVGASGKVVGIDLDKSSLEVADQEARKAGVDAWCEHRFSDAAPLPFESNTFDACHAERVFMHIADPEPVLAEMVRVTKSGGMIVVIDTDGATLSVDAPDVELERRIIPIWNSLHKNPFSGRKLYRLFKKAHLLDVNIQVEPMVIYDLKLAKYILKFEDIEAAALSAGAVTREEIQRFHTILEQQNQQNQFFGISNLVTAVGHKP